MRAKYLPSDNDPLFTYHRWLANLRILEIDEVKTVPYTPISHPFVERLIGSIRRELLDQVFFWNSVDLEKKTATFPTLFQPFANPRVARRKHACGTERQCGHASGRATQLYLGKALRWPFRTPGRRVNTNSPRTRLSAYFGSVADIDGVPREGFSCAMCGRLRVGKNFFDL